MSGLPSQNSTISALFCTSAVADIANMPSANQAAVQKPAFPAEARFVEIVFPEHANHYGTLFGGSALALMAKAAVIAASRHARCSVVMGSATGVEFSAPVPVGQMIELRAWVERAGRSSMTVIVDVTAETLSTGERKPAIRGAFEMIAVDPAGRPTPISPRAEETVNV
jgi:acyl-CoA hydrolase